MEMGIIGLGRMGGNMAQRLLAGGHSVVAYDPGPEAVAAVERMAGQPGSVNYDAIPSVIYTAPEVAAVGLTEAGAKANGHETAVGVFPFQANGRAVAGVMLAQFKTAMGAILDNLQIARIEPPPAAFGTTTQQTGTKD